MQHLNEPSAFRLQGIDNNHDTVNVPEPVGPSM